VLSNELNSLQRHLHLGAAANRNTRPSANRSHEPSTNINHNRARICKPLKKKPRNRFPAWRAGKTTPLCRTGPPGYTSWRNRFLEIDCWAPKTFTNTDSGLFFQIKYSL
jgi:hypothetical protein